MYSLNLKMTEAEFLELSGFVWGFIATAGDKKSDLVDVMSRIKRQSKKQCNGEQLQQLEKMVSVLSEVFNTPSIERGMLQGGMQCMIDNLNEKFDNLE